MYLDSGRDRCEARVTEDLVDSEFLNLHRFGPGFVESGLRDAVYGGKVTNDLVDWDALDTDFFDTELFEFFNLDTIDLLESDRVESDFSNLLEFLLELDLIETVLETDLKSETDSANKLVLPGTM